MAEPPKFSFGSSTPASSAGTSLFGSIPASSAPGSSLFGNTAKPAGSGNMFGSTPPASNSSASSLFGSAPAQSSSSTPGQSASLVGGGSTGASSPFTGFKPPSTSTGGAASGLGALSTPNKTENGSAPAANNIFGATTAGGGNLFGSGAATTTAAAAGTTTPAQNKTLFFGNLSTTPAGPPPASNTQATGLFSSLNKPQEQKSSLFGGLGGSSSQAPSTSAPAPSLFGGGNLNATSSGSTMFSSNKPSTTGSAPATQATQLSVGATSQPNATNNAPASNLFSSMNKTPAPSSQGETGPSKPASALFGGLGGQSSVAKPLTQPTSAPLFSSTPTSSTQVPTSSAAPSGNTLFKPASGVSDTPKPTFNLGGLAATGGPSLFPSIGTQSKPADSPATTAATTTSTNTGTSAPASNLFTPAANPAETNKPVEASGVTQPAAQAQAQAQSTAAPAETSKPSATLGASTSGPKPTPQSRLKNKSMDEIITRWATDLTKYQKEFQSQAKKVAQWDRILVENSDKIMKLYGSTLEAERATFEVERQLAAVENDQSELEYWLDTYEKQVDEMTSGQVGSSDSLTGPDQERERTYKLAEKLSDRLDEMSKDLTSMVDEINDASSHLNNNNKPDDPLSQIVRVLNGHLSQLQQIDQGTAALQTKVSAAQKASRGLSSGNGNVLGNDSVADFYRSYTRGR